MRSVALMLIIYALVGQGAIPTGRAIWVYDVDEGQPAMWAPDITEFNKNATYPINIVYSYGGDMEYYPGTAQPFQTYFSSQSQQAALIYGQIPNVTTVITVIDGRMDGGQTWSPNLSLLNSSEVKQWADITAALYCSYDQVAGIQIDLEPFIPPYADNLILFLGELAADLVSPDFNCQNQQYPEGRVLSTFLFAGAATPEVYQALGPLGYTIISGYDLSANPPGTVSTPDEYSAALTTAIKTTIQNLAGTKGFFSLGLPAAASTHEFEKYVEEDGKETDGFPMYSNSTASYMTVAVQAIRDAALAENPSYLGPSLWGCSSIMAYPPHSDNVFYPTNPFATPGETAWLQATDF